MCSCVDNRKCNYHKRKIDDSRTIKLPLGMDAASYSIYIRKLYTSSIPQRIFVDEMRAKNG